MIECWKSMRKEWIVSFQLINLLKFYQYWIYELFPPLTNQAILGIHDLYVYTLQKCVLIQGKIEKLLPCYLKSVIYLLLDIPIYECAVFRRSINTREGGGGFKLYQIIPCMESLVDWELKLPIRDASTINTLNNPAISILVNGQNTPLTHSLEFTFLSL